MPFNRLNHDLLGVIRPRFKLKVSVTPEEALTLIHEGVDHDETVSGYTVHDLAQLKIPPKDNHYWSPELQVRFELPEDDEPTTYVSCLIGPKQSVWAMFAFFYAMLGCVAFFSGFYGLNQLDMGGNAAPWLWVSGISIIVLPSLYTVARIGQKTGRDQMLHLVSFLYHTLSEHGTVERVG